LSAYSRGLGQRGEGRGEEEEKGIVRGERSKCDLSWRRCVQSGGRRVCEHHRVFILFHIGSYRLERVRAGCKLHRGIICVSVRGVKEPESSGLDYNVEHSMDGDRERIE
jgi:hypothetical protein